MRKIIRYDSEMVKIAAVNHVLNTLGEEISSLIRQHLRKYDISLTVIEGRGSYSLEQLRNALESVLGERAAMIILESIYLHADEYSEALTLTIPKSKKRSGTHRR